MKNVKHTGHLDFSLNSFCYPFANSQLSGYYNSIIDLVYVSGVYSNPTEDHLITTQECIHRMAAFNPMHCYMRQIASYLYREISGIASEQSLLITPLKPQDIAGQRYYSILQSIIDTLHDAIELIQEVFALFGTVRGLTIKGFNKDMLATVEQKYIRYYEDMGVSGFKKLYSRFKYALSRLGGERHGCGLVQYAMSPPWTFPVEQKLEHLASGIAYSVRNDPMFSPLLRLERLLSIIEDCPYVDFRSWEIDEKDRYIRTQLAKKYNHLVKRPFNAVACYPYSNQCHLYVQNEHPLKTLRGQCFDTWQDMCMNWQSSMQRGILTKKQQRADDPSQPLSFPTFFCSGDKRVIYKPNGKLLSLLVWESLRQQISKCQGLTCPLKTGCEGFGGECDVTNLLSSIWRKTKYHSNDRWTKPECPYNQI